MNWQEAVGIYEAKLSEALFILKHALRLSRMPKAGVSKELRQPLLEVEKPAKIQLERLRKREFRIAVVGLEKAGKSTFINAWLSRDLLPNKNERCTYTTTQIHSVSDINEQRIEVTAKSGAEFEKMIDALEAQAHQNDDQARTAQKDLEAVMKHNHTLMSIIHEKDRVFKFQHLDHCEAYLNKYVADVRYAHAVKEVKLYTSKLAATDGIVFFDVPGLDSGLGKHLQESEAMLRNCDAVICIQRSDTPSLKAGEQQLIEFIKSGDKEVDIGDKLFVFFGRVDTAGTPQSLRNDFEIAKKEWQRYGLSKSERIIPGSAAAYLLLKGFAGEQLQINVGPEVVERLKRVTESTDDLLEEATGIPVIKEQINHYLIHDRVSILKKRCDRMITQIISASKAIYQHVADQFPENPEEALKAAERNRKRRLNQWWKEEKWESIKAEFKRYFDSVLMEKADGRAGSNDGPDKPMDKFKERYIDKVRKDIHLLPNRQEKRRNDIFDSIPGRVFDKNYINYEWRNRLEADTHQFIEEVSSFLSEEIIEEADDLLNRISLLLWHIDSKMIGSIIIHSKSELKKQMMHGLRTLFLRFARPVVRVLIAAPQGSDRRHRIVKEIGPDIELLDVYYEGNEPAYQCMKKYVNHGQRLLYDQDLREKILGVSTANSSGSPPPSATLPSIAEDRHAPQRMNDVKEIIDEVEGDLNALEAYLIHAVFNAAGFFAYRKHELERIYQIFEQKDYEWRLLMEDEFYAQNARLLADVPDECKGDPFDVEVCEALKQLRIAVEKYVTSQ